MSRFFTTLEEAIMFSLHQLTLYGEEVDTGHWQGVTTGGKPDLVTKEIIGLDWASQMPDSLGLLSAYVKPNLPWAEEEFLERVGGQAKNPHDSLELWPWWAGQAAETMEGGLFTHTYSERFWPHVASGAHGFKGIRYRSGDLDDVIGLLKREPFTRQAYLPIFFPEDTGAVHGGRIPCTLGYHFLLRNDRLHLWYDIRSCDAVRHFRDDVYLAVRLCQWAIEKLGWSEVQPGYLTFSAHSFHVHMGDYHHMEVK